MKLTNYNFPDIELLKNTGSFYRCMVWEPPGLSIVLGQACRLETSIIRPHVVRDRVPVYKRPSGGGAVILSPQTLVISIVKRGDRFLSPRFYFSTYTETIVQALQALEIKDLNVEGISDICIGDKKILGSSIYRNRELVWYHAVLNRAEDTSVMDRYLTHPGHEPTYRRGRRHGDFVTSLVNEGYCLSVDAIKETLLLHLRMLHMKFVEDQMKRFQGFGPSIGERA
ncbi:MAG: biotin/lipoate A/B protein ligase family protein [Candidatus Omnitrophota bacterium]